MDAAFADELAFWDEQISGRGQYSSGVLTRLDLTRQPPEYRYDFEPLILRLGEEERRKPRVVDVGSGPASIFSYGHATGRFALIAVDPLADAYQELLQRHGYAPTSPMMTCGGESLTTRVSPNWADLAWSYNAIDHATDPLQVFRQMVLITRPGGIIAIQVFENEGTAAAWTGMHQHNITKDDAGRMVCTSRSGESRIAHDPEVEAYELDFPLAITPKVDGRRWLTFFYRKLPRRVGAPPW
jgi:SAM-dependent methyltransferase